VKLVGLMSGTSTDGVDAALVEFAGDRISSIFFRTYPIEAPLRARIRSLGNSSTLEEVVQLDVELGRLFAGAVNRLLREAGVSRDDSAAVGSHGQTVLHLPRCGAPTSVQIGDPNVIALETGITTVADFRRMDMAAGGEGAPLAPAFHAAQFRAAGRERVVLNIGGIANLSVLPGDAGSAVLGFDSGPGNGLMDDWARQHLNQEFDQDGRWAASGTVVPALIEVMLADPYFQRPPPKSTGREYFNLGWLATAVAGREFAPEDVQATLAELSARTIADALRRFAAATREVLVCGGGIHNVFLMERLRALLPGVSVVSTGEHGVDPDCVEAVTFAWLAKLRIEGKALDLSRITGSREPVVLGGIYEPARR